MKQYTYPTNIQLQYPTTYNYYTYNETLEKINISKIARIVSWCLIGIEFILSVIIFIPSELQMLYNSITLHSNILFYICGIVGIVLKYCCVGLTTIMTSCKQFGLYYISFGCTIGFGVLSMTFAVILCIEEGVVKVLTSVIAYDVAMVLFLSAIGMTYVANSNIVESQNNINPYQKRNKGNRVQYIQVPMAILE